MLTGMSVSAGMDTGAGWAARLDLQVLRHGDASILGRRKHSGPLRIQRPFYPEGPSPLHLYLLHPPGGLVGGDRLEVSVTVEQAAAAVVTTPAAQKLYRSAGAESVQRTDLTVKAGATLEWFPSETLAFDGALARSSTRVQLASGATYIGWELGCWGRPASGQRFTRGAVQQQLEIYRDHCPLIVERVRVSGGSSALTDPWGYAGHPAFGALYCVPAAAGDSVALVDKVRSQVGTPELSAFGVSAMDELLVARVSADNVEQIRRVLVQVWQTLRPEISGRAAELPRIWAT